MRWRRISIVAALASLALLWTVAVNVDSLFPLDPPREPEPTFMERVPTGDVTIVMSPSFSGDAVVYDRPVAIPAPPLNEPRNWSQVPDGWGDVGEVVAIVGIALFLTWLIRHRRARGGAVTAAAGAKVRRRLRRSTSLRWALPLFFIGAGLLALIGSLDRDASTQSPREPSALIPVRELLGELESIGTRNEEIYDTAVREAMVEALSRAFIEREAGYELPSDYGMFSTRADLSIRTVLARWVGVAATRADQNGLDQAARCHALWDSDALTDSGIGVAEFFGGADCAG